MADPPTDDPPLGVSSPMPKPAATATRKSVRATAAAPSHIKDLISDPENRRKHNPRNLGMVVEALHKVGAARSIVIDEDNVILAGNDVTEAAAEAGITAVRFIEADGQELIAVRRRGLTKAQKRALAIFDNRTAELAEWDTDQLRADIEAGLDLKSFFGDEELAALLKSAAGVTEGKTDPDDVPDQRATDINVGDLFELGKHRLLCGDSTKADDVAAVMAGVKADCVFTSPPYGVGIDYGTYKDTIENLRSMLPLLAERWLEHVVPGGFAVINFGDIVPGREAAGSADICEYPMAVEYWPIFRSAGWALWSRRIWCKPNARVHSPWAIQSNRAASDWEHCWTWKAPGDVIVGRVNKPYQSANGWFDTTSEHGVDIGKETHGAGMAVALPLRIISQHSRDGAIVHEPFMGTGTTLIACDQTGRWCYGIEIEPKYVQIAIDRWEAFTGQKAVKVDAAVCV